MDAIARHGSGVLVLINRPVPDFVSRAMRIAGAENMERTAGVNTEQRDYGNGAQILAELGVRDMILMTNNSRSLVALEGYGLSIVGEQKIDCD